MYKTPIMTAIFILMTSACSSSDVKSNLPVQYENNIKNLVVTERVLGHGKEARDNSLVQVHYTGWLYEPVMPDKKGKKFDSSHDRGTPFVFTLGEREVIAGWEKGIKGMRAGGQRSLIIPADMAYGARGAGRSIPPNATLIFDVELLQVN